MAVVARRVLVLGIAVLLLCSTQAVGAAPALAITPSQGQLGTTFVAQLSGFTPLEVIALRLTVLSGTERSLDVPKVTIKEDGTYTLSISSLLVQPGDYRLSALRQGEVVTSARFTVTAAATPTRSPSSATVTRPRPTGTSGPFPTATLVPPAPPPTGNGGNLPGLPNTGGGFTHQSGVLYATVGLLVGIGLASGFVVRRVARRVK